MRFDTTVRKTNEDEETFLQNLLADMTLEDKIGQMSQMEINMLMQDDPDSNNNNNNTTTKKKRLDWDKANLYIGTMGIGSVLNAVGGSPNHGAQPWSSADYRQWSIQLQQIAKDHGRPPVIWGLDSVHGANYLRDATWTPSPLNLAATFNRTQAALAGQWASQDTRAAGIHWLFSPLLGLAWVSSFARVYETFGEDPYLVGLMATAMIQGIERIDDSNNKNNATSSSVVPNRAAACAKHFIGYPMPRTGHDRAPSWIPTRHLYQYFVRPWQKVLNETNVKTIMESYTETDGVPNVANPQHLRYLLRYRLQFKGVLVTDYNEINNLNDWHHIVKHTGDSVEPSTVHALKEGTVDMSMIPYTVDGFVQATANAVRTNQLDESRIHESARRVLRLKMQLGMFDADQQMTMDNGGSTTQEEPQALQMARDSLILTKTTSSLLPLRADAQGLQVLVTGPTANSRIYQTGGWTVAWQGPNDEKESFTTGSTVYQALLNRVGEGLFQNVIFRCGTDILGEECSDDNEDTTNPTDDGGNRRKMGFFDQLSGIGSDIKDGISDIGDDIGDGIDDVGKWISGDGGSDSDKNNEETSIQRAVDAAKDMDLVLICVGEEAYAEKPGDIRSLYLPFGQLQLVQQMRENYPTKPLILVYFGGRPRLLDIAPALVDAVVLAFLPGPHGGEAVADLLSGHYSPSGRLPITYPAATDGGGVPYLHTISDQCTTGTGPLPHYTYAPCPVEWSFGHGLSYVDFVYSNFQVSGNLETGITVRVEVANTGTMEAAETVMVFTFDEFRSTTPEYKRLRAVEKIWIQPKESKLVTLDIPSEEFKFVGPHDDHHYILDPTISFWVVIGANTDCRTDPSDVLCVRVEPPANGSHEMPLPACQAACDLWMNDASHSCGPQFGLSSFQDCLSMCQASSSEPVSYASVGTEGWGWNYVNCLESVLWGFQQEPPVTAEADCAKMTRLCRDVFATEKLNEFGLGQGVVKFQSSGTSSLGSSQPPPLLPPPPPPSLQQGGDGPPSSTRPSAAIITFALLSGLVGAVFIVMAMSGVPFRLPRKARSGQSDEEELAFSSVEMFTVTHPNGNGISASTGGREGQGGDSTSLSFGILPSDASDLLRRIEYRKRQEFTSVPTTIRS
ncbi:hypothetical protein ACA910_007692 [Epithemia clementina (nom. ined.)]